MKFKFNEEELTYLYSVLRTLASASDQNRQQRRNIVRLAKKFAPWSKHTYLKPKDRAFVVGLLQVGINVLQRELNAPKDLPPGSTEKPEGLTPEQIEQARKHLGMIECVTQKIAEERGENC